MSVIVKQNAKASLNVSGSPNVNAQANNIKTFENDPQIEDGDLYLAYTTSR